MPGDKANTQQQLTCYGGHKLLCMPQHNVMFMHNVTVLYYIIIQGYKQRKGFIIAQSPMVTTVKDFIKMLYERECGVVVMLCGCDEGGVEMCAQYWPATAGTMMKYGEFMVSIVSINATNNGIIQRAITITDPKVRY